MSIHCMNWTRLVNLIEFVPVKTTHVVKSHDLLIITIQVNPSNCHIGLVGVGQKILDNYGLMFATVL